MKLIAGVATVVATRIKGDDFHIDPEIPPAYMIMTFLKRALMKIRGVLRFPRSSSRPFIGRTVSIACSRNLRLGRNVTLHDYSYIDAMAAKPVRLGDNVSLGKFTRIECSGSLSTKGVGITVGNNVGLGSNCFYGCAGGIDIGADTIVGNYVTFHSENHVIEDVGRPIRKQGVSHLGIVIGEDVWIGAKATILDGVVLGKGSVVAAGAVMTAGEYAPFGIYGGVPARKLTSREK